MAVLAGCAAAAAPAWAAAPSERWLGVGFTTGARTFSSPLMLDPEVAIGLRVAMGMTDRLSVAIDGSHSSPTRKTSKITSSYGDVRVLGAYRFASNSVRPYLLTGLGGQFFNFHDAPGSAGAVVVGGAGVEVSAGSGWVGVFEGSVNLYRAKYQTFSEDGDVISSTSPKTYGTGILTVGLEYRF